MDTLELMMSRLEEQLGRNHTTDCQEPPDQKWQTLRDTIMEVSRLGYCRANQKDWFDGNNKGIEKLLKGGGHAKKK